MPVLFILQNSFAFYSTYLVIFICFLNDCLYCLCLVCCFVVFKFLLFLPDYDKVLSMFCIFDPSLS